MGDGPGGDFFEAGLELGEGVLNRIEIGTIRRKKAQNCACCLDGAANGITFVGRQVVHDDDVAGLEHRREELFGIGQKGVAVDRPVEHHGGDDAIDADAADKRRGLPVAMGNANIEPIALGAAPARPCHGRGCPGLIKEEHAGRVEQGLPGFPLRPLFYNVGPFLFSGMRRLFLSVMACRSKKRQSVETATDTPLSACSAKPISSSVASWLSLTKPLSHSP